MSLVQGIGDLGAVPEKLIRGQRTALQSLGQGLPLAVLHDQIVGPLVLADIVEAADVGVRQAGDGPGFTLEAGSQLLILGQCGR